MSERKIRIRQDGQSWAAEADVGGECPASGGVAIAPTPWGASASLREALGEDTPVAWETLPWEQKRIAYGITGGIANLLGASLEARRAIDASVYAEEMREL